MSTLLPCPWCGGTDIHPLIVFGTEHVMAMLCGGPSGCGAHGPRVWGGGTREQAVELWNKPVLARAGKDLTTPG